MLTGSAPVLHARPLTAAEMMADDQSYATTSDDELEDDMFAVDSSGAADRAAAPGAYAAFLDLVFTAGIRPGRFVVVEFFHSTILVTVIKNRAVV